ncbi:hypothetical protein SAMN05421688_1765 [Poseidonocella pacifica]|uniref:Uncharacterized protein n=1 Tax=Poseidonocella pacifica TaxID=871651 RepID=A0A1I0X100_9RHOB|nr:hypothetical protein SAMN05421688_1765 [Poseidonocella pacifica]
MQYPLQYAIRNCEKWRARTQPFGYLIPEDLYIQVGVGNNRTRARPEPTPSELLKATGMQPCTRRAAPATH